MGTIIYYFSATGNSLKVARDLSEKVGETQIISILDAECEPDFTAERIGIVFPVYMWGVPSIVKSFIEKMGNASHDKYIFAVATCKSSPGGVLYQLQREMKKQKVDLSAGFTVFMPGNNIIYYNPDSIEIQNAKFEEWDEKQGAIASTILNFGTYKIESKSFIKKYILTGFLHKVITKTFQDADKHFWPDINCTGCGVCAKVCPVKNIDIIDRKPVWQHKCEQCVACINLCPKQAIQYSKTTVGRARYRNPFVEPNDLKRNN